MPGKPSYELRLSMTRATRTVMLIAAWKIREALAEVWGHRQPRWLVREDDLGGLVEYEAVPLEQVDPPQPGPRAHWRSLYAAELLRWAGLGWALAQPNPLSRIFRRAKLTETPQRALEMWLEGESVTAIARALRRRRETVAAFGTWTASRPGPGLVLEALEGVEAAYRLGAEREAI